MTRRDHVVIVPPAFRELVKPHRYKVFHGGRGGAKSWSFATILVALAAQRQYRILCTREFQNSIADSVHKIIADRIQAMRLDHLFVVNKSDIYSPVTGSEFMFKGIRHNPTEIKSTEGVDICWLEEAQKCSKQSLEIIAPTIRKPGSELWISLNPDEATDPIYQDFVLRPPPNAYVRAVNFDENPFLTHELEQERQRYLQKIVESPSDEARLQAQADYDHVWLGMTKRRAGSAILKRWVEEPFETPIDARFHHGLDFGFANDPTAFVRSFVQDECLFVDMEASGLHVEIDDTPSLLDRIPTARSWPIKADGARPETISYLSRQGFNVTAAEKWPGSVEDGIAHLNAFKRIVIHPRCQGVRAECVNYRFKVDRQTDEVLPIIVDAHNHFIDGLRYGLDGYIQRRGELGIWAKLGT